MASQQEVSMSDSHFPEPSSKERKPPLVARETADEGDGELEKVRTSWAQGTVGKRGHRGSSTSDTVNFESEVDYKAKLPRRRKMSGCWGLSGFSWTFLLLALAQGERCERCVGVEWVDRGLLVDVYARRRKNSSSPCVNSQIHGTIGRLRQPRSRHVCVAGWLCSCWPICLIKR